MNLLVGPRSDILLIVVPGALGVGVRRNHVLLHALLVVGVIDRPGLRSTLLVGLGLLLEPLGVELVGLHQLNFLG